MVKSITLQAHIKNIWLVFERLQLYKMRPNPIKCVFSVDAKKLLGFIVSYWGIEIDIDKIDAIVNMPPPRNISRLCILQGKVQVIYRFMVQLANCTLHFMWLLKKDVHFKWNEECEEAFNSIKSYLANHPILILAMSDRPFFLYISTSSRALEALLAQCDDEGWEIAVYYISHTLIEYETRYFVVEKKCLSLVFAT